MSIHQDRPFNTRYVIWNTVNAYGEDMRSTHRTAKCSYWYINRMHGIDEVGPTPNYAARQDLVDRGRCGPSRANDPALQGIKLWEMMDQVAKIYRPTEATLAHCVASLPIHETAATWREIVEGFCDDHLSTQGMITDWAIHAQSESEGKREILPHVHMLITTRVYDRTHADFGRRRQNWLRTSNACKSLADKWYPLVDLYPGAMGVPLRKLAA
ncbi:MobA/MobL family protein [Sphingomonas sp. CD22]|uniref:MobA/MobL family protein n=1 Tax=Sphingomonas sp. CD22 TaxID=3100214 RepID=UPI002AE08472|nr:MobA/MobL family protein [Sphingomonas sp. CD22]MEA1085057.1 MobA/MobL family protein [Sphingomonas sp. CD22]